MSTPNQFTVDACFSDGMILDEAVMVGIFGVGRLGDWAWGPE